MRARPSANFVHQFQITLRSKNARPIELALELEVELEFGFDVDVKLEIDVEIEVEPELALEPNVKKNAPTLVVFFFGVGASGRRPGSPPTPRDEGRGVWVNKETRVRRDS